MFKVFVVSHRETWIEIVLRGEEQEEVVVVSHRETWIEIVPYDALPVIGRRLSQRDVD